MDSPTLPPPPPFFDFLQELRRRGVPISVAQHQDVATLCARMGGWSESDARGLARGLAALLGRDKHEVITLEQAFFQHYAEAYLFKDNAASLHEGVRHAALGAAIERAQRPEPKWRWRWIVCGMLSIMLALTIGASLQYRRHAWPFRTPAGKTPAMSRGNLNPSEGGNVILKVGAQPLAPPVQQTQEPNLPPLEPLQHRGVQALWVGLVPLVVLLVLYGRRRKHELRGWARNYWRQIRGSLDGPTDFTLTLLDLREPLPRYDLEDMATILGRGTEQHGAVRLNVPRSVQRTLEYAALPALIFERQGNGRPLLVLCDICADMDPWERKTQALITGLRRRGVRMDVYYFDGDASRIAREPFGRSMPLSLLYQQSPNASLLVLSTGSRMLDANEERRRAGKLAPWVEQLSRFRLRVWLHPVGDPTRWRPTIRRASFARQYVRVVPMGRAGLLAAAYELAQEADRRVHISEQALQPLHVINASQVYALQRLVALYPGAPLELAELLRQQFYPQTPEEVVLELQARSQDGGLRLHFDDQVMAQLLRELQLEDQALAPAQRQEEKVRRYLLKVLRDSEPVDKASLGHLKWRLRKAMQQIYLHDPEDENVNEAVETLKELVRGPLWEEAHGELWALGVPEEPSPHPVPVRPIAAPVAAKLAREVLHLVEQTAGGQVALPGDRELGEVQPPPRPSAWRPLRAWEVVPAVALSTIMLAVVVWCGIGVERLRHEKAYELTLEESSIQKSLAVVRIRAKEGRWPLAVKTCLDADCLTEQGDIRLQEQTGTIRYNRDSKSIYVHVRAQLSNGNLAYSEGILIPGYKPTEAPKLKPAVRMASGTLKISVVGKPGDQALASQVTVLDAEGKSHLVGAPGSVALPEGTATMSIRGVTGYWGTQRTVRIEAGVSSEVVLNLRAHEKAAPVPSIQPTVPALTSVAQTEAVMSVPIVKRYAGTVTISPESDELSSARRSLLEQILSRDKLKDQTTLLIVSCPPEIGQFLNDVNTACVSPNPAGKNATAMCSTKQIHAAVISADPNHQGRFLKFMSVLEHEAFYMRRGATEITKFRRERLERLARVPLLPTTTFLVVAHPAPGDPESNVEAFRRAKIIADKLRGINNDIDEQRIFIWVYAFPLERSEIELPADRPAPGEPIDRNLGVWLFRVDC